jgi:hypothetical protein
VGVSCFVGGCLSGTTLSVRSCTASTGIYLSLSPRVGSQSARSSGTWFSFLVRERACQLVQHSHVFTRSPSLRNPYTIQLSNVLCLSSFYPVKKWTCIPCLRAARLISPGLKSRVLRRGLIRKHMWREIAAQGYPGSQRMVYRFLKTLKTHEMEATAPVHRLPHYSSIAAVSLCMHRVETVNAIIKVAHP